MTASERELIEEKFKGVYLHLQTNFDNLNDKTDQVLKQATLTNSRVNKLEEKCLITDKKIEQHIEDEQFIMFFSKNPKILLLAILGVFALFKFPEIIEVIKTLIN